MDNVEIPYFNNINQNNNIKNNNIKNNKKNKTKISIWQKQKLRTYMKEISNPKKQQRIQIGIMCGLLEVNVKHWFKNERKKNNGWKIIKQYINDGLLNENNEFSIEKSKELSVKYNINETQISNYVKNYCGKLKARLRQQNNV